MNHLISLSAHEAKVLSDPNPSTGLELLRVRQAVAARYEGGLNHEERESIQAPFIVAGLRAANAGRIEAAERAASIVSKLRDEIEEGRR